MILAGESRSTQKNTYPSATLPATSPTCTGQGLNQDLCIERPVTNSLNYGMATWQYGLCGMYGRQKRNAYSFWWETLNERDDLKDSTKEENLR